MRKPFSLAYLFYFVALLGCEGPQQGPDPSTIAQEHGTDSLALAEVRPPPLSSHVMVYHRALGMVVMFGGSDPNRAPSNTLWGWNGSQWRVLSTDGPLRNVLKIKPPLAISGDDTARFVNELDAALSGL